MAGKWRVLGHYKHPTLGRVTTVSNNSGNPVYVAGTEATQGERAAAICERLNGELNRTEMREVLCRRMRDHGFQPPDLCDGKNSVCGWCDITVREMQEIRGQ